MYKNSSGALVGICLSNMCVDLPGLNYVKYVFKKAFKKACIASKVNKPQHLLNLSYKKHVL